MDYDFNNKTTLGKIKLVMLKGEKGSTGHSALVANSVAEMTDKTQIYVYTGATTADYTFGDWCYWDGSEWVDGGAYNAAVIETDKSLTVEDQAADAKATGDRIDSLADMTTFEESGDMYEGWIANKNFDSSGELVGSGTYAACETFIKLPENAGVVTYKTTTNGSYVATYSSDSAEGFIERIILSDDATLEIDTTTVKYIRVSVSYGIENNGTISWSWQDKIVKAVIETAEKLGFYAALKAADTTQIIATQADPKDYNDYTTPGNYINGTTTSVGYTDNLPAGLGASHRLYVLQSTNASRVIQIIVSNSTNPVVQIYKRIGAKSSGSWTWYGWTRVMDSDNITDLFDRNTKTSYTLPAGDYRVGSIIYSGDNGGKYTDSTNTRVSTPDVHVAETDLLIRVDTEYALFLYLFDVDGTYIGTYNGKSTKVSGGQATINAGQRYKISIGKDGSAANVPEYYDKAEFLNPLQQAVQPLAMTADPRYLPTDYGVLPTGVFYPGTNDTYDKFLDNSGNPEGEEDMMNAQTSDVYDAFDELVDLDPYCVTKASIGTCSDGEQLIYKYDFNPKQAGAVTFNEPIPTIFLVCGQHGYEKASVFSLYYLFKHMISNPFDNPVLNYLRYHVRIICVPVANPWGFDHNTYKNFDDANHIPVNLNRNWAGTWQPFEGTDAEKRASTQYGGEAPFDQPETEAIRALFDQYKHLITFCIDYHTNGDATYATRPKKYNMMNANLMTTENTPLQNVMKSASRFHIREITSHFVTQYDLDYAPGTALWTPPVCGYISAGAEHSVGTARDFFTSQDKLALTFETFPGFPEDPNNPAYATYTPYTSDVIKASEELISNYIIAIFNYLNKS